MAKKKTTETEEPQDAPEDEPKEATLEDELAAMNEDQRKSQEAYRDS